MASRIARLDYQPLIINRPYFTATYNRLGVPIWGAVVLRHEKGLSTTFKPQGPTIVGFYENRQALLLKMVLEKYI